MPCAQCMRLSFFAAAIQPGVRIRGEECRVSRETRSDLAHLPNPPYRLAAGRPEESQAPRILNIITIKAMDSQSTVAAAGETAAMASCGEGTSSLMTTAADAQAAEAKPRKKPLTNLHQITVQSAGQDIHSRSSIKKIAAWFAYGDFLLRTAAV